MTGEIIEVPLDVYEWIDGASLRYRDERRMTNALRPSEIFTFRWKRFEYRASTLMVAKTAYKGRILDWGKTKKSLTVIHIPRQLTDDLQA